MRIGYDVDETLIPFMPALLSFLTIEGFKVPPYEGTHSFDLWKPWDCSPEESFRRVWLFFNSHSFQSLEPFPEAFDVLSTLRANHSQIAITSRPGALESVTRLQLDRGLPQCLGSIHHTDQYRRSSSDPPIITKGGLCRSLGVDLFVDDALHHVQEIVSQGIPVLVPTRPWNTGHPLPKGAYRIKDLREVPDYVALLAQEKL
jgi:hypothetical protein